MVYSQNKTLYERDFNLWLETQALALRTKNTENIDWANLPQEIEDMVKKDKRSLSSFLLRILEHLLKLKYWDSEKELCRNGWIIEVTNFRDEIYQLLADSPSLKNHLELIYSDRWQKAKKNMRRVFPIPEDAEITLDQVLDEEYFGES